jgi:hypothetical protein
MAWDQNLFTMVDHKKGKYYLSIYYVVNLDSSVTRYTWVYRPADQQDKSLFIQELREAKPEIQDRSYSNCPTRHLMSFRALIDDLQSIDIRLQRWKLTWLNEREHG